MDVPEGYKRLGIYRVSIYRPYDSDVDLGREHTEKDTAVLVIEKFLQENTDVTNYREGRIDERVVDTDGDEVWWLIDVVKRKER